MLFQIHLHFAHSEVFITRTFYSEFNPYSYLILINSGIVDFQSVQKAEVPVLEDTSARLNDQGRKPTSSLAITFVHFLCF